MENNMNYEITEELARKVLATVDAGLIKGLGIQHPGSMCVEAAVCYAMGLPHSDEPTCVSPALRVFKIELNDSNWSGPKARAKGMRRLAIAQLGSAGVLDDLEFAKRVATLVVSTIVPKVLRIVIKMKEEYFPFPNDLMEDAAVQCETNPSIKSITEASRLVRTHATPYYYSIKAIDYSMAAIYAATIIDRFGSWRHTYSAMSSGAAVSVYANLVNNFEEGYACDLTLSEFAENIVQILIDMKAPGCQWLWLTE
jgi:hypothetical protein